VRGPVATVPSTRQVPRHTPSLDARAFVAVERAGVNRDCATPSRDGTSLVPVVVSGHGRLDVSRGPSTPGWVGALAPGKDRLLQVANSGMAASQHLVKLIEHGRRRRMHQGAIHAAANEAFEPWETVRAVDISFPCLSTGKNAIQIAIWERYPCRVATRQRFPGGGAALLIVCYEARHAAVVWYV
jgi:hypothetical protein